MIASMRKQLGVDGAIAYTFLARTTSIAASTGTVLLIVHFLNPIEQGYYYTLLSLVALQIVFELGFSFVIQQLAAHECVHLELHPDGAVTGDRDAHARLASALRLSIRWYTIAAVAMALLLTPLGDVFFVRHASPGVVQVAWRGPWLWAVIASAINLWCTPFYAFLEGCGEVRQVAALRLRQSVATAVGAWIPLLLNRGLYSPAVAMAAYLIPGLFFIAARHRLLIALLRHSQGATAVHWTREVWPFQWRIAVSSTCAYFTVQILIPILFALRGPVEAGQMGMSISITNYITTLALTWTSTKTTPFGNLIALRQFHRLDGLFRRTLGQSIAVFAAIALLVCAAAALLPFVAPRVAARMVSLPLFTLLSIAAGAKFIVQSLAILLRSFKREPFLVQSVVVALATLTLAAVTAPRWGSAGVATSYITASAGLALPWAILIFTRARKNYMNFAELRSLSAEVR